jgi:hypothetical protein
MTAHTGTEISSLRIGTVTAVRGRRIEITVDVDKNDSSLIFQGEIISNVSIGSFLIVRRGYAHLAVQVEEEELIENNAWENSTYQRDVDRNTRILKTTLLGEFQTDTSISPFQTRFVSGSQTSPLIGNIAYVASAEQASKIYTSSSAPGTQITIGHLATNSSIPINLDINTFFSSHIGIFGDTGSGKSYSLSKIYTQLFESLRHVSDHRERLSSTRFIIFDYTGEYSQPTSNGIFRNTTFKTIYHPFQNGGINPANTCQQITLPENILLEEAFWVDILAPSNTAEHTFILQCLQDAVTPDTIIQSSQSFVHLFFTDHSAQTNDIGVILGFLSTMHALADPNYSDFKKELSKFNSAVWFDRTKRTYQINGLPIDPTSNDYYQFIDKTFKKLFSLDFENHLTLLDRIAITFTLRYYINRVFNSRVEEQIVSLITRLHLRINTLRTWFTFNANNSQDTPVVHIINLQNATPDDRALIPHIITRIEYDAHKKKHLSSSRPRYLNFILEDAHNVLGKLGTNNANLLQHTRQNPFEEIVTEGRQYGVFATIVTQRPSDIPSSITSQLHHYLIHRLVNTVDLESVKNAVMFLDRNSFESIPSLPRGTCIISGTSFQIPAIVKIDKLDDEEETPDNETINLVKLWGLASGSSKEAGNTEAGSADTQESESAAEES